MSNIPERWAARLVQRGYVDRRGTSGAPSLSALADACGTSTTTISNAITGRRTTSAEVVNALVKALGPDVADWLGVPRPSAWEPPAEASLLTDRQRKAVEEIIRAMTERREEVGNDERSAPTSQGEESSPTETSQLEDLLKVITELSVNMPSGGVGTFAYGDLLVRFFDSEAPEAILPSEDRAADLVTAHDGTTLMVYLDTYQGELDIDSMDDAKARPRWRSAGEHARQLVEVHRDDELPTAAHPDKGRESKGRQLRRRLDEVGEENQDPGEEP